jgi:uncharacterized phage protein (TIGR02216 family)
MAAGLGLLRVSPAQFWAMTPRELSLALRGLTGCSWGTASQPLNRHEFSALMQRFPDTR